MGLTTNHKYIDEAYEKSLRDRRMPSERGSFIITGQDDTGVAFTISAPTDTGRSTGKALVITRCQFTCTAAGAVYANIVDAAATAPGGTVPNLIMYANPGANGTAFTEIPNGIICGPNQYIRATCGGGGTVTFVISGYYL